MRQWFLLKNILRILLVLALFFLFSKSTVLGQYSAAVPYTGASTYSLCPYGCSNYYIQTTFCNPSCPAAGSGYAGSNATSYGGSQYAGFYLGNNNVWYPINTGSGGAGPSGSNSCTGVYGSCTSWGTCSASCGPGTQTRNCYDTGCGTQQTQSQSCQVNDPNVWGAWGPCTANCGGGTQTQTNQCGTVQSQACNTQPCGPWIKLRDTSFYSVNSLTNVMSSTPTAYDIDDTTQPYFIVYNDGVVAAPTINIDISNVSPTTKTGNPEYKAAYTPEAYALTPASFVSYVKARKDYTTITALSDIKGGGLYFYDGNLTVNSDSAPFNAAGNIVIASSGTVTVAASAANTFAPVGSVSIVAQTINFDSALTQAKGIFIGNTIDTGTNASQGLKIIGNLVAQSTLTQGRSWGTTSRPALFVKFDQTQYINLLPYLSVATYDWQQAQ